MANKNLQTWAQRSALQDFAKRAELITEIEKKSQAHKRLVDNMFGIAGMILIQGASIPTLYMLLNNQTVSLPDLSLVAMVWGGLVLYLIRSLRNFKYEWVYTLGNICGLTLNAILIWFIFTG